MEKQEIPICMICLQEGAKEYSPTCTCRLLVHSRCWKEYCIKKGGRICLICRAETPLPVEAPDSQHKCCVLCCCCCLAGEFFLQFL